MTTPAIIKGVHHVALYAPDPEALAGFYSEVLGLHLTGLSGLNADGVRHSVFLSHHSQAEHHHLAIFVNPEHQHIAFEVASLADLRLLYQRCIGLDLPIRWSLNHGDALAFYFSDPVGNLIKLYWPTGVAYPQPHGHPIDLSQSEAALRQDVADLVAQLKGSKGGGI